MQGGVGPAVAGVPPVRVVSTFPRVWPGEDSGRARRGREPECDLRPQPPV